MEMNNRMTNEEAQDLRNQLIKLHSEPKNEAGESEKLDAIIISKLADRKNIDSIKANQLSLKALNDMGNIAHRIDRKKTYLDLLSPLYLHVTVLARKANVNLGTAIDKHELTPDYMEQENAVIQLNFCLYNLACAACDLSDKSFMSSSNEQDIKDVQSQAVRAIVNFVGCLDYLAKSKKSSIESVQRNVLRNLDQLINLI